ncbi:hypothetical protein BH23ACT12_BH23ACT12_17470 [soil metagenome]
MQFGMDPGSGESPSRKDSIEEVYPRLIEGTAVELLGPLRPLKPVEHQEELGYDIVWPIGAGDRAKWMEEINIIFLSGVPRALRNGGRVYLLQGRDIFWSAPVKAILSDSDRISWISGEGHGEGPSLWVDLSNGTQHDLDATEIPPAPQRLWHNKQGLKYVTPGCERFVTIGPKPPKEAMKARSSPEVALERALRKHFDVDPEYRRVRLNDNGVLRFMELDICSPALRLVVEYDGWYWHRGRRNRKRDSIKTSRLRAAGLYVIRVREHRLRAIDKTWDVKVDRGWTPDDMVDAVIEVLQRNGISPMHGGA